LDNFQLAQQAARGDGDAFRALAERYRNYIYSVAWRITLDAEDALDVTQQVYLRMVERIGDFNGAGGGGCGAGPGRGGDEDRRGEGGRGEAGGEGGEGRSERAFRGWLGTIAAREAISLRRKACNRETPTGPQALAALAEGSIAGCSGNPGASGASNSLAFVRPAPGAREVVIQDERRRHVAKAMSALSPQQRAIFLLRFQEDIGPKEIAQRLAMPGKQVRSQLHRAIVAIRRELAEKGCLE